MVYGGDKQGHIGSQNVEFVGIAVCGNIGPGEQANSTVFQALDRADMYQFIQGCPHRHITTEALYQFRERNVGTAHGKRGRPAVVIQKFLVPPPGSNHPVWEVAAPA